MRVGVMMFPTDTAIQPVALARAVEEHGFESLWFPEHSHIPVSRKSPWGGQPDAPPLPEMYWRTHDQFVALAAASTATSTLRLATGITLVAQRDPLWLAKEVASLDVLSGGRFLFGIGYGWNREEAEDHGIPFRHRREILREKVLAMRELWTKDVAEFHGTWVDFEPSWAWPKPEQRPHPPIVMGGGAGPKTFAHIAEFCQGWMPIYGRHGIDDAKLEQLGDALEAAGRPRDDVELGMFGVPPKPDVLVELAELGLARAVLALPPEGEEEIRARLARYAKVVDDAGITRD
ncbi:MAG TPA: TIGR03619 family F420-dependent LLM class oxidoreductase [Actinobacteria bacterium]|nr:TIGR03619 family F420-dependent LLM class oxidoreductase [Actinomycetota bacterium]